MRTLATAIALSLLTLPGAAFAAWGDELWGIMIWGESLSVPTLPGFGLIVLAAALSATAAWRLRHRRGALGLPVLLVSSYVRSPPLAANGSPEIW